MKKIILSISLFLLFIPTVVNAESKYLYDVLKDEAEKGGLAREYTGEHHDSFTKEPSHKIFYWYGENNEEGNQLLEKNNIIFGGFCWQIIRTTDTGGIKVIYNGIPNAGKCNNIGDNQQIANVSFNNGGSTSLLLSHVGYMYNPNNSFPSVNRGDEINGSLYGNSVTYSNGTYTLVDTERSLNDNHHYSCNNQTGVCETVRYYFYKKKFIELTDGKTIEEVIEKMLLSDDLNTIDSGIKATIDDWFRENMLDYVNYIEDTIYCNDKTIVEMAGWDPNGGSLNDVLRFKNNSLNDVFICENDVNKFSIYNPKAKLIYPVGLITLQEAWIEHYLLVKTGSEYWTMTPEAFGIYGALFYTVESDGRIELEYYSRTKGVRPVISLKSNTKYLSGDGSKNSPYIISTKYKINVEVNNETENLNVEIGDLSQVQPGEEVNFNVTPSKGRRIKSIRIIDEDNNEVEYETADNKNYSFKMPAGDITIIPSYERVSNAVNIEKNNNTEEIIVKVNDATAVVYEDKVRFYIKPVDGYEIESILIKDKDGNSIEYQKTEKENEYEFTMPDTDVNITPVYRKIETINVPDTSKNYSMAIVIILSIIISLWVGAFIYNKKKILYNTK